jgi:hypothetical protein
MGAREIPEEPDEAFWGPRPGARRFLSGSVVVNVMIAALAVLIAATLVALVVLWPAGGAVRSRSLVVSKTQPARVTRVETLRCAVAASQMCQVVSAKLLGGADKGETTRFDFLPTPGASRLALGDRIRVLRNRPRQKGHPPTSDCRSTRSPTTTGGYRCCGLGSRSSCCCSPPGASTGFGPWSG